MSTRTLTATLPAGTLYVSGTVNGATTTWTNTEGQTWQTVAERSETDVYVVALTIINAAGTSTISEFTLYYGLHLITDRKNSDVERVKELARKIESGLATEEELAEWNSGTLKGSYDASDLNRVGAAMNYVSARLEEFGYTVSVSPKTDWLDKEWPAPDSMKKYLDDLAELRSKFALMESTPAVPGDMEQLTYTEANNIEKILEDIDLLLTKSAKSWFFCGDLYSGEV